MVAEDELSRLPLVHGQRFKKRDHGYVVFLTILPHPIDRFAHVPMEISPETVNPAHLGNGRSGIEEVIHLRL
jgi:hypothetical protein